MANLTSLFVLLDELDRERFASAAVHATKLTDLLALSVAGLLLELLFDLGCVARLAKRAGRKKSTTFATWGLATAEFGDFLDVLVIEALLVLERTVNNLGAGHGLGE